MHSSRRGVSSRCLILPPRPLHPIEQELSHSRLQAYEIAKAILSNSCTGNGILQEARQVKVPIQTALNASAAYTQGGEA